MMSETPSQPSTTPARRRQGRGNGRAAAQKAYASENDAANVDFTRYDRTPRTPQKTGLDSPAHHSNNHNNSKQRSRNKPKSAKNIPTSPESGRAGRHTPPHQSSSMKSIPAPAFAGATFHASPAPSALPLPSFISKPPTESPSVKPTREILQEPSPPTDNEAPTPSRQSSAPIVHESPLDFMFRAHRQEQERQRLGSPASLGPSAFHDSPSTQSVLERGSMPKPSPLPQSPPSQSKFQPGIGSSELDGTPGRPMGPAFSTPYQERIKAARSGTARSPASQQLPRQSSAPEPGEDPAEALKRFLFNGPSVSSSTSNFAPSNVFSSPRPHAQANNNSMPHTQGANSTYDGRSNNLQAMEDDLRRILKLDLTAGPSNAQRRLFS